MTIAISPADLARLAALGVTWALVSLVEARAPHTKLRPEWAPNLGLWLTDLFLTRIVCGACAVATAAWAQQSGFGVMSWLRLCAPWQIVLSIVWLDFVAYAWHRANHRFAWLWRWHRVHHADAAFHVGTALRFHPGELLQALPLRLVAVAALGVPVEGLIAFEIVFGMMNFIEHGNIDLPLPIERRIARFIVTPALHRMHHASDVGALNTNFGTIFSVFDHALSTYRASSSAAQVRTGVPGLKRPSASLCDMLLLPLRADQQ